MANVFEKWDPSVKYLEGEVVYFGDKLYVSTYSNMENREQENLGILPIRRQKIANVFNIVDNNELIDQLVEEYHCKEDSPITTNITYNNMNIIGPDNLPITFTDEELFYWELA